MKTIPRTAIILGVFLVLMAWAVAATPDSDICPIHKVKMQHSELRLIYGMPSAREFEEMRIAKTQFPYGRDYVLAGCVVKPAKTVDGFLCADCIKARESWLSAQKGRKTQPE